MAAAQTAQTAEKMSPAAGNGAATLGGAKIAEFTKEQELDALRHMLLIRRFEEKAGQMYEIGRAHV